MDKVKKIYDKNKKYIKFYLLGIIALILLLIIIIPIIKYRMPRNTEINNLLPFKESNKEITVTTEEITNGVKKTKVPTADFHKKLVAEKNGVKLFMDFRNHNFIIEHNGETYETNNLPYDPFNDGNYQGPFTLEYFSKSNNKNRDINVYKNSIKPLDYKVYEIENGYRVYYNVQERTIQRSWVPTSLRRSYFEQLLKEGTEEQVDMLKKAYRYDEGDLEQIQIELRKTLKQSLLEKLYNYWWKVRKLTFEQLIEFKREFKELEHGLTIDFPSFNIPVEYKLDEKGNFVVEVLNDKIEENSLDIGENTLILRSITMLKNFLSFKANRDTTSPTYNETLNSFFFIPDGSGSLVLPNRHYTVQNYFATFYENQTLNNEYLTGEEKGYRLSIPSFGYGEKNKGILATIEFGVSDSKLTMASDDPNIYSTFIFRRLDNYEFVKGVKSAINEELDRKVRYKLSYSFLTKNPLEYVSYFDMVRNLQDKYISSLRQLKTETKYLLLDLLGAITEKKHFLGIPYYKTLSLTSYNQFQEIIDKLNSSDILYKYSGFGRGGYKGSNFDKIRLESALGSKKDFNNLIQKNPDIYFDVYLKTYFNNKESNFSNSKLGLQLIGGKTYTFYDRDRLTNLAKKETFFEYYLLNPNYIENKMKYFADNSNLVKNISLRDIGNSFYANFTRDVLNGDIANIYQKEGIKYIKKQKENRNILLNNPYFYAAIEADNLENIPTNSSKHVSFYSDIPFLQLLYSPYMNVFSSEVNIDNSNVIEKQLTFAKMSNSGIKYLLTYENSNLTKKIPYYNFLYSTKFSDYEETIKNNLNELNSFNETIDKIINHKLLDIDVYEVSYANGKTIVYNLTDREYDMGAGKIANPYSYQER